MSDLDNFFNKEIIENTRLDVTTDGGAICRVMKKLMTLSPQFLGIMTNCIYQTCGVG